MSGNTDARRGSKQQLRQTVQRVEDALFGDPGRLDRDLWLARLADLLLDGSTAVGQFAALEAVRDGIRQGVTPIDLRGYSHVFVTGGTEPPSGSGEQEPIQDLRNGLQEVFTREELRQLIKAYHARRPMTTVREALGPHAPWRASEFRLPAERVSWTVSENNPVIEPPVFSAPFAAEDAVGAPANAASSVASNANPVEERDQATIDAAARPIPSPATASSDLRALISVRALQLVTASQADVAWLEASAQKLRSALLGYGLQAKVLGTRLTPNAALVRLMGSDRLRVEDIESKQSALLTTHGLRLVAISPLPGEIVVAVARPHRQVVSLWDVWARRQLNRTAAGTNTSYILGLRELDGEILYLNIGGSFAGSAQHEPHTLIAGATGSGKSVLMQGLILDIAATNPSRLAQIFLIDPKMGVDYAALERLPHVQGGVIVDQARAISVLEALVLEMDRRYEVFRAKGVRDLKGFNSAEPPQTRLPLLFLVHDEFAEWMLTDSYKDAVTASVQRLGVKARAAGIHLVFAAQRPDVNVMPIQLRDNLGNRLILKVASVGTSEIALGVKGAEALLGLGHLAARLSGESGIVFAQAPFLSDEDIVLVVDAIVRAENSAQEM